MDQNTQTVLEIFISQFFKHFAAHQFQTLGISFLCLIKKKQKHPIFSTKINSVYGKCSSFPQRGKNHLLLLSLFALSKTQIQFIAARFQLHKGGDLLVDTSYRWLGKCEHALASPCALSHTFRLEQFET